MTNGATTMSDKSTAAASGVPETMSAITQDRYGEALEVLSTGRVPVPDPGADEVLIEVAAAGVDQGTWHLVAGMPLVVRLGFGFRRPRNPVPGLDVSGTVVKCGEEVRDLAPGDAVFGIAVGELQVPAEAQGHEAGETEPAAQIEGPPRALGTPARRQPGRESDRARPQFGPVGDALLRVGVRGVEALQERVDRGWTVKMDRRGKPWQTKPRPAQLEGVERIHNAGTPLAKCCRRLLLIISPRCA